MEEIIVRGLPLKVWNNPSLIHRVLLTDPSEYVQLTWSGQSRVSPTPSFSDYKSYLLPPSNNKRDQQFIMIDMENVVKGAFVDGLSRSLQETSDLRPVKDLLRKLHLRIRHLIPSRHDLHSILNDEAIEKANSLDVLFTCLKDAARALERLESPERAETTNNWIRMVEHPSFHPVVVVMDEEKKDENLHSTTTDDWPKFVIESIFYFLYKCDLCESDKLDFYLSTVWAQRIWQERRLLERIYFLKTFGMIARSTLLINAPNTVAFLKLLVEKCENRNQLVHGKDARLSLIRNGWIDEIVFRSSEQSLQLPEVFSLDVEYIHRIRESTRFGVASCALALHACKAANCSPEILTSQKESYEQNPILAAELYEQNVADVVVSLANSWNESGNGIDEASLRGQTTAVLQGKDPVLQLLTTRMQKTFREIVNLSRDNEIREVIPPLKSGYNLLVQDARKSRNVIANSENFIVNLFCKRGLSFCASDVAKAADLARKIVNLMWSIHGSWMDPILEDECNVQSRQHSG